MNPNASNWIDNASKNAPVGFVRDCASHIQQKGYLSLGEFFERVSDKDLNVILGLILDSRHCEDETIRRDSFNAIAYLLIIIRTGAGIYTLDPQQLKEHMQNFESYAVHEMLDRREICDVKLRAKRMQYSIEVKPEERKWN